LLWGTLPILCHHARDTDRLVSMAEGMLEEGGYVRKDQVVGIVAGTRTKSGATNFMRLHTVGDSAVNAAPRKSANASAAKGRKR
jgi:pyruvate kinase